MAYLRLSALPEQTHRRRAGALTLGKWLAIPFGDAERLLAWAPVVLPLELDLDQARELERALLDSGLKVETLAIASRRFSRCQQHPRLEASEHCTECGSFSCPICQAPAGSSSRETLCPACRRKRSRRRGFFWLRLSLLVSALLCVLAYAYADLRRRHRRNDWNRPVQVALVVLPKPGLERPTLDAFMNALPRLEHKLADEFGRYGRGDYPPFDFTVFDPVFDVPEPPSPKTDDVWQVLRSNYELWRFSRSVDTRLGGDPARFDTRLYVVASAPASAKTVFVEGFSQQGGTLGVAEVDLDPREIDFALFVVAHELMHTVGASDKYGADGNVLLPAGLAEPERQPRFPQHFVEVMARGRPVSPTEEVAPEDLEELRVGPMTAREIGWISSSQQ